MTKATTYSRAEHLYIANPKVTQCADALAAGEVVAYPTEAVWGLGCDPFNRHAVEKVLQLKNRAQAKGVILIAGDIQQLDFLLFDLAPEYSKQLQSSWPGPHTWLVPHHNRVPAFIHGDFDTVAVRVTTHPVVKALCHHLGGPIVSTSANPQGLPPATTSLKARCYFSNNRLGHKVHYCPGSVGKANKPSRIQHLITGDVIRAS